MKTQRQKQLLTLAIVGTAGLCLGGWAVFLTTATTVADGCADYLSEAMWFAEQRVNAAEQAQLEKCYEKAITETVQIMHVKKLATMFGTLEFCTGQFDYSVKFKTKRKERLASAIAYKMGNFADFDYKKSFQSKRFQDDLCSDFGFHVPLELVNSLPILNQTAYDEAVAFASTLKFNDCGHFDPTARHDEIDETFLQLLFQDFIDNFRCSRKALLQNPSLTRRVFKPK